MCRGVVFPLILGTLIMGAAPQDVSWPSGKMVVLETILPFGKLTYVQERLLIAVIFYSIHLTQPWIFGGFPVNGYVQTTVFFHQQHANAYSFCANEWDSLDFEGP